MQVSSTKKVYHADFTHQAYENSCIISSVALEELYQVFNDDLKPFPLHHTAEMLMK